MDQSVAMLVGITAAALAGLAAFTAYCWQQRSRVRRVKQWVTGYLHTRFGTPLNELSITCTNDRLWPVLARFDDPRTGTRHRLQFSCLGPDTAFALLSEKQESRSDATI
jgi:hypothetical protein